MAINNQQIKKEENLMGLSSGDTKMGSGSNNHLKDFQSDNQSADILRTEYKRGYTNGYSRGKNVRGGGQSLKCLLNRYDRLSKEYLKEMKKEKSKTRLEAVNEMIELSKYNFICSEAAYLASLERLNEEKKILESKQC